MQQRFTKKFHERAWHQVKLGVARVSTLAHAHRRYCTTQPWRSVYVQRMAISQKKFRGILKSAKINLQKFLLRKPLVIRYMLGVWLH